VKSNFFLINADIIFMDLITTSVIAGVIFAYDPLTRKFRKRQKRRTRIYSEPINFRNAEIRLLNLLPGSLSSPVECSLWKTTLDRSIFLFDKPVPQYTALSYEWGDSRQPRQQIKLNGHRFWVRDNLYSALKHLRSETDPQTFWIDAICIDQKDVGERNHQVSLMSRIYQNATSVKVWLGNKDESTNEAFSLLQSCGRLRSAEPSWNFTRILSYLVDRSSASTWQALTNLLSRSYWNRIWIIQEFLLGRRVTICCGDLSTSSENLNLVLPMKHLHINLYYDRIFSLINHTRGAEMVRQRSNFSSSTHLASLVNLIKTNKDCNATDPRDKIYALLGLARDGRRMDADYTKTLLQIKAKLQQVYGYDAVLSLGDAVDWTCVEGGLPRKNNPPDLKKFDVELSNFALFLRA
jgi:hypothetical protein